MRVPKSNKGSLFSKSTRPLETETQNPTSPRHEPPVKVKTNRKYITEHKERAENIDIFGSLFVQSRHILTTVGTSIAFRERKFGAVNQSWFSLGPTEENGVTSAVHVNYSIPEL